VVGESKGSPKFRALIREALGIASILIIPPIVVTETFRDNARDVHLNLLFKRERVVVPAVDFELAKEAGSLLAAAGTSNAPDAQVVAEAIRRSPCTILASDEHDITVLAGDRKDIRVINIDKL